MGVLSCFLWNMEMLERVTEFPHTHMDRRPRKRPRLGWMFFLRLQRYQICSCYLRFAQLGMFCGQEVGNVASFAPSKAHSDQTTSSMFVKGVARNGSPPWREDDKDGHYIFALGENLTSRYKINSKMGEGFGMLGQREEMVAVKIVRGIKKYREAAMIEIEVLQQLAKHDKGGNRCVQIRNWFDYRNHICIVFEKLGPSLYDFLRKNNYRSFPIDLVREIGRQLLECVAWFHCDSVAEVGGFDNTLQLCMISPHTYGLKPENILLVSPEYVKVPDYKLLYERQDQNYIVSTRHYRRQRLFLVCHQISAIFAVVMRLGWSYPCDIWSVGCILVELCTGEALFQTHENLEHLAMMERVLGPLPQHMLKRVDRHAEKYVRRGRLDWPEGATSRESIKAVLKLPRLQNLIMQHVDHSAGDLIHLLQGLLRYDPSDRLTALGALRHPFFTRDHLRRS
ncbi:hypothetical protein AAG906_000687 [Vitis piasezkii]